jgi:hypothetical protein
MKFLIPFLFLASLSNADVKISQLPLGSAATSGVNDSFPYANATTDTTARLDLSDLVNLPSFVNEFELLIPDQSGQSGKCLGSNGTITAWVSCGAGTVSTVSIITANGFAGTVANATSTPAITLSTSITGILQGNGTAISAATIGNLTDTGTDGITVGNGTGVVLGSGTTISQHVADTTHSGYLSSTDWNTFNGKTSGGITALTGDGAASGPGSAALTLATVNSNVGSFGTAANIPSVTVNGKGLVTAASNIAATPTPAASIFSAWDANKNFSANGFIEGFTTTATAAGTTTLVVGSTQLQYFTGSSTQTVKLPTTSVVAGAQYIVTNLSTGSVTVQSSGANTITTMASKTTAIFTALVAIPTTAANWNSAYQALGTIPVSLGGTGVTSVTTAPAATVFAGWDANKNLSANNIIEGFNSTATAAGTTALAVGSAGLQYFTGTTTQTVTLPTTGIVAGGQYIITNLSTGLVTVQSSGANTVLVLASQTSAIFTALVATPTTAANWNGSLVGAGGANVPTVQKFLSGSGAYTTPANVIYIEVKMVGGGGGGSGSGTASGGGGGVGGNGSNTTFGTSLLAANAGSGGQNGGAGTNGGAGGTASIGSGASGTAVQGTAGGGYSPYNQQSQYTVGGYGSPSALGGGAGGAGGAGAANSGGGGGGGDTGATLALVGLGGGSGGFVDAIISNPSSTYSYVVGNGGSAGSAGTSGSVGFAGGSGYIIVTEYYANGTVGTATNVTGIVAKANGGTGQATYPGDYYASVYYPASSANYWSNNTSSTTTYTDYTVVGTIPSPSTLVNSNFGTVSKATSNLPGINFVAPRTGTISFTVTAIMGSQSTQWGTELIESTTSTVLGFNGGLNPTASLVLTPVTIRGFFQATSGTTYNFKLQGLNPGAGTHYITGLNTSYTGSELTYSMEYIN